MLTRRTAVSTALMALAAPAWPSLAKSPSDEEVLRRIKTEEWPRYYRDQDVAGLARFLADDFVVYTPEGASTKAEELAWLRANPWRNDGFVFTISRLSIYGDTALIVGEGLVRFASGPNPHRELYVSSNLLVRRDGRWRPVSSHVGPTRREPLA